MHTQIKISWLHVQSYCEYQLYLMVNRQLGDLSTPSTAAGKSAHADLDALQPHGDVRISSLADRIDQAQAKYQPFTVREADVHGIRAYGRIDQLEYHLNHVAIIDNKPKPPNGVPFYGDQRQILAYCMAFTEEFPNIRLPVIAKLRDYDNKEFWAHTFTQEDRPDIDDAIDRILGILNETRRPFATTKTNKCQTCFYLKDCDATLLRRR